MPNPEVIAEQPQQLIQFLHSQAPNEEPRQSRASFLDKKDFITDYVNYADVLEAPREMHEAVAMVLIATLLNRNGVTIDYGPNGLSLDFWIVLLSNSGFGRSTLIEIPRPILQAAGLEDVLRNGTWGSPQALYQDFAEHSDGLHIWGELSQVLKLLNERHFVAAKQWLTDRYDNFRTPESVKYRKTGRRSKDTPEIRFVSPTRTNFLATSSESWFFESTLQSDSTGGFVPRWMILRATGPEKVVPLPRAPDVSYVEPLAKLLRHISGLKGMADLSEVLADYSIWYEKTRARFASHRNRPLALAFFNRHRVHILKLAVIYEASMSGTLRVSPLAWNRAEVTARRAEQAIFSLLETGMENSGYILTQMAERIRTAGEEGLTMTEFTRTFQHLRQERIERLQTLLESGTVARFQRETAGRPLRVLVHEDFETEYRAKYPKSTHSRG